MSARYGMWATYVLDMDEWRRKAVDKSTSRRPIADFNLLAERESEISPPFEDARSRPRQTPQTEKPHAPCEADGDYRYHFPCNLAHVSRRASGERMGLPGPAMCIRL
jgi:hypothetical protein